MNLSRFFLFICLAAIIGITAGRQLQAMNQSSSDPESLIRDLEREHGVRIFYLPVWLENMKADPALLRLPLQQAIQQLISQQPLHAVYLDDMVFIVPSEGRPQVRQTLEDQREVIGNPADFGRYARARITGKVLDASTYEPLFGAVVYESVSGRGATADFNGTFELELPVGDHELRISYVGYDDAYQRIRLISNGQITLELFPGATQLAEFTVTARRAEENVSRTQMSLISLDSRAIQQLPGSFGEQDIVRSLTLLPGVQTVGEFGSGFNVRGGSADQNLILVENVPLFNSSHLFGLISVINPDMVSNVTLMKAGIPAMYGERASSVMDIRLNTGLEEFSLSGGLGILNSRLQADIPIVPGKTSLVLGGRSSYSDWYLRNMPDEDLFNSEAGFWDLSGLLTLSLNQRNTLTMFGYTSFDRFAFGQDTHYQYGNTLASFRWNSILNNRLSSTLIAGYSGYDYRITDTPEINQPEHFRLSSSIGYQNLKWYLSYQPKYNHSIDAGINAIRYEISPGMVRPFGEMSHIAARDMQTEYGLELSAFISDDIEISDRFSVDVGLRYTQYLQLGPSRVFVYDENLPRSPQSIIDTLHYLSGDIVSRYGGLEPRIGMRYSLGQSSSVKLSYNRINQYINLISNTAIMAPADVWKLADPHLKPLQSDQFALGYFRNFLNNTLETSIEAYYKGMNNAIEYKSGAEIMMNETLEADVINARGYNYGLEFYIRKNSGRLTGWTSYTWSVSQRRTRSSFAQDQINNNTWFPSNYDRPHNLVINTTFQASRRWRFGGTFTYNTGRPVTLPELAYVHGGNLLVHYSDRNKYRLPDFHRLDISITLDGNLRTDRRGKGSWTLSIMNVYGRKNPYSVFYRRDVSSINSQRGFNLYQLYVIGRPLPTLTYNFSF